MKTCRASLAAALALLCLMARPLDAAPDDASAADAEFSGSVVATAPQPILVTSAATSVLRPGQSITVTLSGEVDINQERKSKRKCGFLGLSCKRVSYTDHNFRNPSQLGATFVLRPKSGGADLRFTVYGKPFTYKVPGDADYRTSYDLLAALDGAGTGAIDSGRSSGAYKVRVAINGVERANRYATWLASNPNVDLAVSDEILDQITRSYGTVISAALRNHAKNRYPLAEPTNRSAHGKLVTRALMLAPNEPANSLALADYYTAVGLTVEARNTLNAALALWNQQPEPRSPEAEQSLGEVYLKQARAALETRGGLDEQASLSAAVYLDRAAQRYEAGLRPDLAAAARVERARLLRGTRSIAALREAAVSLETALAGLPSYYRATASTPASAGRISPVLLERPAVALAGVDRPGLADTDTLLYDSLPLAFDSAEQMLVATDGTTLQWRALGEIERVAANVDSDMMEDVVAAGGRVLGIYPAEDIRGYPQRVATAIKGGAAMVPVTTLENCRTPILSLAADGLSATVGCNSDFASFRFSGDSVQALKSYSDTSLLLAGNAGCGFLRIAQGADGNRTATLERFDGASIRLVDDAAMPFVPDWSDDKSKFAFSGDGRVIALRADGTLSSFSCATGKLERELELLDVAQIEQGAAYEDEDEALAERWDQTSLSWASPTRLAVRQVRQQWLGSTMMEDMVAARVALVDWPGGAIEGFDVVEHAASPWAMVEKIVLPPDAVGTAPRVLRSAQFVSASRSGEGSQSTSFGAGEWQPEYRMLAGGRYLLAIDDVGAPLLVDLSSGAAPAQRKGLLGGPLEADHAWFDLAGSTADLGPVRVWRGDEQTAERPLPALSPSLRSRILADLHDQADVVPLEELDDGTVIAEATLRLRHMPGLAIAPLSAAEGVAARLLCGIPVIASSEEGRERVLFEQENEQISLLVATANDVAFLALPPEQGHNCVRVRRVAGAQPALLRAYAVSTPYAHRRLSWWTGGAWKNVGTTFHLEELAEREFPDAAWTRADGTMLMLTHERYELTEARQNSDPEAERRYRLHVVGSDGSVRDACKGCDLLELEKATVRWELAHCPPGAALDLIGVTACGLTHDREFLRVDASGTLLIYPLHNELVVRDLASGKELLRTSFGKPLDIDREKVSVLLPADKALASKARLVVYKLP